MSCLVIAFHYFLIYIAIYIVSSDEKFQYLYDQVDFLNIKVSVPIVAIISWAIVCVYFAYTVVENRRIDLERMDKLENKYQQNRDIDLERMDKFEEKYRQNRDIDLKNLKKDLETVQFTCLTGFFIFEIYYVIFK